jgi:hypothetical protein
MVAVTVTLFCYDHNVAISPEDPAPPECCTRTGTTLGPVVGADALTDFPC